MLCQILLGSDGDNVDLIKGLGIDDFMMNAGAGSYSYSELLLATEVLAKSRNMTEMKEFFESLFIRSIKSLDAV